ncbi:hypothetical protein A3I99_04165 [Candidatus Kaiserbacteria bacterium RIFCSPLOWO2_02_FULL_45_11b]|uniref:Uncharacterized protein n=1 Tax=Candidatus Kaiserbacteria bacterium RIFCSPLOWO2_12_FULL_45_26 TaxID=1798525 RepID=A0A1F6FHE0_9BACT|nr:MAG: hypothetical protein A2Z56_00670 [Candidatus Kaiserbacteria bacterium RIFCSPHIGHO2_12_45_16]OGG70104.1 MAG: hypothetical protein A2929_03380 [Candidatus Kaiserbacteria bacterium RIFCSPLOWO2_01_FULL_45_25]OGG83780.1 MAG: hypothetical protein A3I99_04165 [Candidatus Kaiserbacteria bacterium RIFCSPLOWO2_02_FULL_45_11b]OGG85274.1 MAG: hypothetical protein A3G90_04440 [Candidatus Kaiserbacteria bacterium RIFCSPLOWO2_12_FULL_45_26]
MNFFEIFLPVLAALWLICSLIALPSIIAICREDKVVSTSVKITSVIFVVLLGPYSIGLILDKNKD